LGLPVSDGLPKEVFALMDLNPQPKRGQPSVQYIPILYEPPRRRPERALS
jgi:hypothetical protein